MDQAEIDNILNNLDYDKYLQLLANAFTDNWMNVTPEYLIRKEEEKKNAKEPKEGVQLFETDPASSTDTESKSIDENVPVINENTSSKNVANDTGNEPNSAQRATETPQSESAANTVDSDPENKIFSEPLINAIDAPKTYAVTCNMIDANDIAKAERQLNLGGVRIGAEHDVLKKVIKALIHIDIS